jgi:nucleoside-diphosphate-sugar epimerase
MKILITGGAGFIGHHFVEHILKNTSWEIIIIESLSRTVLWTIKNKKWME